MKFFVGLLLAAINIQAQDISYDLALLHQSFISLEQHIPQEPQQSPSPSRSDLLEPEIVRPSSPGKKTLSPEQQAIVAKLAKDYEKKSEYIVDLIEELEALLSRGPRRPLAEINLKDKNLIDFVKRRLSTANIEEEAETSIFKNLPTHPEQEEETETTTRKISTDQDKATVKALAEDILKHYKKDFPDLSEKVAYNTAVHLFEGKWVSKWGLRNNKAVQEGTRFIRTELKPIQVQNPPQTSGILGNLAGKISWLLGGDKKETEKPALTTEPAKTPPVDEWAT